jgi:hypothetical protein
MSLNKENKKKSSFYPDFLNTNYDKLFKTRYKDITYFLIHKPKKKIPTKPPTNT